MQYHYLVIILAGSTDDMAVLNMSLRSWCLSEDMTDRESTAPGWVVTLYSLSAVGSLCLDFRFFSGLDHDLVEYGMANLKLLKRLNNRCYHTHLKVASRLLKDDSFACYLTSGTGMKKLFHLKSKERGNV